MYFGTIRKRTAAVDMTTGAVLSLLLLPFFMVTGKFRPHLPVSIQLPVSQTPGHCVLIDGDVVTLVMGKDGRTFLRENSGGWMPFSDRLPDDLKAHNWHLKADKKTPYVKVNQLFSLLRERGVEKIKLVTE